jgi:hypothetical protein
LVKLASYGVKGVTLSTSPYTKTNTSTYLDSSPPQNSRSLHTRDGSRLQSDFFHMTTTEGGAAKGKGWSHLFGKNRMVGHQERFINTTV